LPLAHTHQLRSELNQKAIDLLVDLSAELSWNVIAQLLESLLDENRNWYSIASQHQTSIHSLRSIYTLAFETRVELKTEIAEFILERLREKARSAA
jgi:hypothetical protein